MRPAPAETNEKHLIKNGEKRGNLEVWLAVLRVVVKFLPIIVQAADMKVPLSLQISWNSTTTWTAGRCVSVVNHHTVANCLFAWTVNGAKTMPSWSFFQGVQMLFRGCVERSWHERHFWTQLPYFLLFWLQIFQFCLSFWSSSFDLVLF